MLKNLCLQAGPTKIFNSKIFVTKNFLKSQLKREYHSMSIEENPVFVVTTYTKTDGIQFLEKFPLPTTQRIDMFSVTIKKGGVFVLCIAFSLLPRPLGVRKTIFRLEIT